LSAFAVVARVAIAIVIVTALVGPWLYLVHQRESKFLGTSVGHDVFKRIAQPLEGHTGPPGYHLALIFATFLPWSVLLPMAIVSAWKNRADPQIRFALAAVLGPWVMFELVRTKLPHYMLPAFPPLAFLTADAVVRCLRGEKDDLLRPAFRVAAAVCACAVIGLGLVPPILAHQFSDPRGPVLAVTCITLAAAVWVFARFLVFRPRSGLLATGISAAAVYAVAFALYLPRAPALRLSIRTAAILPNSDAIMLDYKEPSLAFYQGGTIREESAMTLSSELLDGAPPWIVVTREVWDNSAQDLRQRVEIVGTARGLAYADGGRTVEVMVLRKR
jgi:4-amino-4-deoxy-L-arabinose transferase-like glycosyltransferase